jgi:RHS repeat-associated protein
MLRMAVIIRITTLASLFLLMLGRAAAQICWTPVSSWTIGFSTSGSGSGPCSLFTSCSVSESAVGSNINAVATYASCAGGLIEWDGITTTNFLGQVNDEESSPCPDGITYQYSGINGSGDAASGLVIQVPTASYLFDGVVALINGTWTITDYCAGGITQYPFLVDAGGETPPPFSLPATIQQLSVNSDEFTAPNWLNANTNWSLSFTATPDYNPDDDCKQQGSNGYPASSSIGCETQSLGEDITVAGTGFHLHYETGRAPGAPSNGVASTDAAMIGGWTLSVHHAYDPNTNTLFLGDGGQRNGYQLGQPVLFNGGLVLTSEEGSAVYVFSLAGQHLQTVRPMTGALIYQFGYDSSGELVSVTDASGNVSTIQRNASEQPTAIVGPYGQTTLLAVDANGFLSQVTDPMGKSQMFVNSSQGLLTSRTDANGNVFNYAYDDNGRLTSDADPLGGSVGVSRTDAGQGLGWTAAETTSMGRTSSYQSTLTLPWIQDGTVPESKQTTVTWPDGLQAASTITMQNNTLSESTSLPDGTTTSATMSPDPRWGLQAAVPASTSITLGSLTANTSFTRYVTLASPGNPFSLTSQIDTETINGLKYTSVYTGSTRTFVARTPVGRQATQALDSLERLTSLQVGALLPVALSYDSRGRLSTLTHGPRVTSLSYDPNGFLQGVTDPLNLKTTITHDADGRPLSTILPDGRVIGYAYDSNGNLTSVTPPGQPAHGFAYTAVDLVSTYTPPSVPGTGPTTYSYDADRDLTSITRPDGQTIEFGYDSAGRLNSITTPTETISYSYDASTGNLQSASIAGGDALNSEYNGALPISSTWTGTVAGSVGRSYDTNFWITSETIDGGNTVDFVHDNDGLLTTAGLLSIKHDPNDGLVTGSTLGGVTDVFAYNSFGEPTSYSASFGNKVLYSVTFTRDADGRIASKSEVVGSRKNTESYFYDQAGRLVSVSGAPLVASPLAYNWGGGMLESPLGNSFSPGTINDHFRHHLLSFSPAKPVGSTYTYDSNSNRLSAVTPSGSFNGTYDAQDRLLTYGPYSFTYTANGELEIKVVGSQITGYSYDVLGNLASVKLPNGNTITYIVDPANRRIGKQINGTLQSGFLYEGSRIVAQLDGNNQIVIRFVYATRPTTPDYMIRGGVTYRMISDQLGSIRLVVNSSTGAIAEQMEYDEFGNVLSDTNPGFQPFGFAGGLYDQNTKLVRFGARDYDPLVGRWTAKDPILFSSGDTNAYGYVLNDPIDSIDSAGLQANQCICGPEKPATLSERLTHNLENPDVRLAAAATAYNAGRAVYSVAQTMTASMLDLASIFGASLKQTQQIMSAIQSQIEVIDWFNSRHPTTTTTTSCFTIPTFSDLWNRARQLDHETEMRGAFQGPQQQNPGYAY